MGKAPAELEALGRVPAHALEELASHLGDSINRLGAGLGGRS
jgi:hypothetical protein